MADLPNPPRDAKAAAMNTSSILDVRRSGAPSDTEAGKYSRMEQVLIDKAAQVFSQNGLQTTISAWGNQETLPGNLPANVDHNRAKVALAEMKKILKDHKMEDVVTGAEFTPLLTAGQNLSRERDAHKR